MSDSAALSKEFDTEFRAVLGLRARVPEAEIYLKCLKVLEKHELVYQLDAVKPKFVLTHKANRGGLTLSPHNAHRNAHRLHISKAADKKQLVNAVF